MYQRWASSNKDFHNPIISRSNTQKMHKSSDGCACRTPLGDVGGISRLSSSSLGGGINGRSNSAACGTSEGQLSQSWPSWPPTTHKRFLFFVAMVSLSLFLPESITMARMGRRKFCIDDDENTCDDSTESCVKCYLTSYSCSLK